MKAKKISFLHYRNIEKEEIGLTEGVNLFLGDNAQGKTNALEGIFLFANGRSFRTGSDKDLIAFGFEDSRLSLVFDDGRRENLLETELHFGRGRTYRKNGVPVRTGSEFIGSFRAVLFSPEHIAVVKAGPAERRAFLDAAISQLKPVYLSSLQKYNLILAQRNALLRSAGEERSSSFDTTLSIWSSQLAREAAYLAAERAAYTDALAEKVSGFFSDLSLGKEKVGMRYNRVLTEEEYLKKLTENTEREIAAGVTLYGIHKDDIDITLNDRDSRLFASQGQQRSIAFAMKLGEGLLSEEITGSSPVYLLDDVLSELDTDRRKFVLRAMRNRQVIVTTCMPEDFREIEANRIEVREGRFQCI